MSKRKPQRLSAPDTNNVDQKIRAYFAEIGARGGQAKSPAKTLAARKNIKKRWAKSKASA